MSAESLVLETNFYRIKQLPSEEIIAFRTDFPQESPDNQRLKRALISKIGQFILCGEILFAKCISSAQEQLKRAQDQRMGALDLSSNAGQDPGVISS